MCWHARFPPGRSLLLHYVFMFVYVGVDKTCCVWKQPDRNGPVINSLSLLHMLYNCNVLNRENKKNTKDMNLPTSIVNPEL